MKKFLAMAASVALLSACSSSQPGEPEPVPVPDKTPISIDVTSALSRVSDLGYDAGDAVGIYVVNYANGNPAALAGSGNHVDNMRFTYSSKWTPDKDIYWADQSTRADFYCFYPYAAVTNVTAHQFATKADQSTQANYKASEFLWGKAAGVTPTANAVAITTNHVMSNMLIYIQPGEGFTAESLAAANKTVKITNVKTTANVNLSTGVASATGNATTVVPFNEGEYFRALIVPQTVAEGTNLITINVDGVDYTFAKGFTFAANKQHKFTVTVNKASSGVNIGIGGWETDDTDNGGAAE